jgi:predicted Ser/Thr protein kinase
VVKTTVGPTPTKRGMIGKVLGHLKIIRLLGKGGMGEVYLAQHALLNKLFAVKVLSAELTSDPEFGQRFYQEAKHQALLHHPNIVDVIDYIEEDGRYFMVMEYVEGKNVDDLIKEKGKLSEQEAIAIMKDVLAALSFAHAKGLVHRDIKPSNIRVDDSWRAKLMDFGVAIIAGEKRITRTGVNVGTVWYMSPEQIERPKDIDGRSDIYSLGIVLFEMVTGDVPYRADSDFGIMQQHMAAPIPNPSNSNHAISPRLSRIIMKSLAKRPQDRFQTCQEFLNELEPVTPAAPVRRSRWKLYAGAGVLALAVAAFLLHRCTPIRFLELPAMKQEHPAEKAAPAEKPAPAEQPAPAEVEKPAAPPAPAKKSPPAEEATPAAPVEEAAPAKKPLHGNALAPAKEAAPGKKGVPAKELVPGKKGVPAKEAAPVKKGAAAKEETPVKESTPAKKGAPAKEGAPAKKETPAKEEAPAKKEAAPAKPAPPAQPVPARKEAPAGQPAPAVQQAPVRQQAPPQRPPAAPAQPPQRQQLQQQQPQGAPTAPPQRPPAAAGQPAPQRQQAAPPRPPLRPPEQPAPQRQQAAPPRPPLRPPEQPAPQKQQAAPPRPPLRPPAAPEQPDVRKEQPAPASRPPAEQQAPARRPAPPEQSAPAEQSAPEEKPTERPRQSQEPRQQPQPQPPSEEEGGASSPP